MRKGALVILTLAIVAIFAVPGLAQGSTSSPASDWIGYPDILVYGRAPDYGPGTPVLVTLDVTIKDKPGACSPGWPPQTGRFHFEYPVEVVDAGPGWGNWYGAFVPFDNPFDERGVTGIPFYCGNNTSVLSIYVSGWLVYKAEWRAGDVYFDLPAPLPTNFKSVPPPSRLPPAVQ